MKTTLELPDELGRRIKIRAAQRNQKLKDTIAQLLELGLVTAPRNEVPRRAPTPVRLREHGLLSIRDIEASIETGRR